jgi:hypothetical protein
MTIVLIVMFFMVVIMTIPRAMTPDPSTMFVSVPPAGRPDEIDSRGGGDDFNNGCWFGVLYDDISRRGLSLIIIDDHRRWRGRCRGGSRSRGRRSCLRGGLIIAFAADGNHRADGD